AGSARGGGVPRKAGFERSAGYRSRAFIARAAGVNSIRSRIALAAAGAVLVACLLMTVVGYLVERENIIRGIDSRLLAAAAAVPHMLPEGYHDGIFDAIASHHTPADTAQSAIHAAAADAARQGEYRDIVATFNDYIDTAGLPYLYTYIVRDDQVYLTAVNQTPEMRTQERYFDLLMHETDPPPGVREACADGQPRFINYTTRFGSFRSIFVPVGDTPERRYVIGADVTIDFMRASLAQRLVQASLVAVIVSLAVGAAAALFAGRLTRPVVLLARAIDTLGADGDGRGADAGQERFTRESGSVLERIAGSADETGRLASSMLAMQDRLAQY